MRSLPAALTALALTVPFVTPAQADPVVVELFTSQGCSSCPPADAMLGELAGREDVLALSLHVDYWDWIGWADTFADPAFSARQLDYSEAAGSNVRYTPQFVVAGVDRVAGADGLQLADRIDAHKTADDLIRATDGGVTLGAAATGGQIIVVDYTPEATVKVMHGENAGHEMTYHNVVRNWQVVQTWDGSETTLTVPPAPGGLRRAVLAQSIVDGYPGQILGALRLD